LNRHILLCWSHVNEENLEEQYPPHTVPLKGAYTSTADWSMAVFLAMNSMSSSVRMDLPLMQPMMDSLRSPCNSNKRNKNKESRLCISLISCLICAGIFKKSMGATNRLGIGLYRPGMQATQPGGIDSLESIHGLLKSFKIWALLKGGRRNYSRKNQPGMSSVGTNCTVEGHGGGRGEVITLPLFNPNLPSYF
jgi:hypothetical protein